MDSACTSPRVNIRELPVIENITSGDLLIVETSNQGTCVLDFDNFLLPLDNAIFQPIVVKNTSDISSLSGAVTNIGISTAAAIALTNQNVDTKMAELSSSVAGNNTFATFSIIGPVFDGAILEEPATAILKKSENVNIAGFTFNQATSTVNIPFEVNFSDTDYCVTVSGKYRNEIVHVIATNISTNSITLCACNLTGQSVPLDYGWLRINTN